MATLTPSSRTILGPLTTTFSPPASCTAAFIECDNCNTAWEGQACSALTSGTVTTNFGGQDNRNCWPPRSGAIATSSFTNFNNGLFGWGFYSPGLICPTGYATACSAVGGVSQSYQFQFSVLPGETAIGCCPSGYTCSQDLGAQTCQAVLSSTSFQVVTCSSTNSILRYLTLPEVVTITSTKKSVSSGAASVVEVVSTVSSYRIWAPMIQINHQASDVASSAASTSAATPTPTTTSAQPSLSGGAKAGIGIGVSLGFVALAVLGFFLYRRRKGYARAKQESLSEGDFPAVEAPSGPPVELAEGVKGSYIIGELSAEERTHKRRSEPAELG